MWNKSPLSLKSLESLGKFQFQQHLNADLECSFMEIYTDTASENLKRKMSSQQHVDRVMALLYIN